MIFYLQLYVMVNGVWNFANYDYYPPVVFDNALECLEAEVNYNTKKAPKLKSVLGENAAICLDADGNVVGGI